MKISVCIATYNGEKYIKEQLNSILPQLKIGDEIIISDDGSTDNTIHIINTLNDDRIKIYMNTDINSVISNFNNALSYATGDIIFLSDQDDIWLDNKVKLCLKNLLNYDMIVTNCIVTDEKLNITHSSYFEMVNSGSGFIKNFYKSTYLGCCLAFNRKVLKTILPLPKELLMYHDWWIGFLAEIRFSVYFERTPLLLYRRHGSTTSSTTLKSKNSFFVKIYSRLQLLYLGIVRLARDFK